MTLTEYRDLEQGSDEWLKARLGLVTASTVGKLVTNRTLTGIDYACPDCDAPADEACLSKAKKAGENATPIKTIHAGRAALASRHSKRVLEVANNDDSRATTALLVAERILGWSDPTFVSNDMLRGHDIEPIARDWYAEREGVEVDQLGFMVREIDKVRIGYSPDGLVGDDGLIEVKAPRSKAHLLTHLSGEMPSQHMAQVQCGLLVSGRDWCDYVSFYAGMPPFVKRIHVIQEWHEAIIDAVRRFEVNAAEMQAEYESATDGIPGTERLLIDMEMSF